MSRKSTFIREQELLERTGGFKNLLITGKTGIGKSHLADKFADTYGETITRCTWETSGTNESLMQDLKTAKREILKRKDSGEKVFSRSFLIIDECPQFIEVLSQSEDFLEVLKNGESVGYNVILTSQIEPRLLSLKQEVRDSLAHIDLDEINTK